MNRRTKFLSSIAIVALTATASMAQELTLIMHHFLPPVASAHKDMLQPRAEKVQANTVVASVLGWTA